MQRGQIVLYRGPSFAAIPSVVNRLIFGFLDDESLARAMCACRGYKYDVRNHKHLQTRLIEACLRAGHEAFPEAFRICRNIARERLNSYGYNVQSLKVRIQTQYQMLNINLNAAYIPDGLFRPRNAACIINEEVHIRPFLKLRIALCSCNALFFSERGMADRESALYVALSILKYFDGDANSIHLRLRLEINFFNYFKGLLISEEFSDGLKTQVLQLVLPILHELTKNAIVGSYCWIKLNSLNRILKHNRPYLLGQVIVSNYLNAIAWRRTTVE